jgi:chemotaxis signal transduction protein
MDLLLFSVGKQLYGFDCSIVVEVLPALPINDSEEFKHMDGMIAYRGHTLPVVDVVEVMTGEPCKRYYSTRIVVVDVSTKGDGSSLCGCMVEDSVEIITVSYRKDKALFHEGRQVMIFSVDAFFKGKRREITRIWKHKEKKVAHG